MQAIISKGLQIVLYGKNAGYNMAIVGEPCNVNAHAKTPGPETSEVGLKVGFSYGRP